MATSGPGTDIDALLRTGPFHDALRAAIDGSGLTLDRLRDRLARRGIHVSLASLSYWRQGRSRPERPDSLRAVQAIEAILGLPRHSLEALLGPPRPRGRWVGRTTASKRYGNLLEPARALAETVDALVGQSDGKLRPRFLDDAAVLDRTGAIRQIRSRQVVRALADDPDRHVAVYCEEPGTDPSAMDFVALENCRVGRVRRHPTAPVIAAELLFDRTLRAGQTHLFEYKVTVDQGKPTSVYRRAFRYPSDIYVLSVRFHRGRLPVRCASYVQQGEDPEQAVAEELTLTAGHLVHTAVNEVAPGVLGIEWEWA